MPRYYENKLYIATNRGLFFRPLNRAESEFSSVSGLLPELELRNREWGLFVGHDRGSFIKWRVSDSSGVIYQVGHTEVLIETPYLWVHMMGYTY